MNGRTRVGVIGCGFFAQFHLHSWKGLAEQGADLADCIAMAEAASRAGVFLAVHENFRYQAPMRRVQEVLRSGVIGTPSWGRITFRTDYDVYLRQPYLRNEERFIVIDLGVHMLDLARVFLGEVEHLAAETQRRNPNVKGEDT